MSETASRQSANWHTAEMTAGHKTDAAEDFAAALRSAITARGLALERIRYRLSQRGYDLSVATLSYWQSGRSRPERATSLAALGTLEEILQVPRGSLAAKLPTTRQREQRQMGSLPAGHADFVDDARIIDQLSEQLGLSWTEGLRRVSAQDLVEIGADRTIVSHVVHELIQATEEGLDRIAVGFVEEDRAVCPYVTALRNCRVGRAIEAPQESAYVGELLLERPLRQGESILVEYQVSFIGQRSPATWWARGCLEGQRQVHLQITFDRGAIPVAAEEVAIIDGVEQATPIIIAGTTLAALWMDVGPGAFGLRWTW